MLDCTHFGLARGRSGDSDDVDGLGGLGLSNDNDFLIFRLTDHLDNWLGLRDKKKSRYYK